MIPCVKLANGSTTTRYQETSIAYPCSGIGQSGAGTLVAFHSPTEPETPDQLDTYAGLGETEGS